MSKQCLFCSNPVDSAEDIWSSWILEDLKPSQPVRRRIGKDVDVYTVNPELRVKCVCQTCNNGWMSDLEGENRIHIRAMMRDEGKLVLEPSQQKSLARWSVLKAMVIDAVSRKRPSFYTDCERKSLRSPLSLIPVGTYVWLARFSSFRGLHAGGTDVWQEIDKVSKALRACVTSIVVGHLVIQVLTIHVLPIFANRRVMPEGRPGAWDLSTLNIWPVFGALHWPPAISFGTSGRNSLGEVINRWKVGTDIA